MLIKKKNNKILVLLTGQLRYFNDLNFKILKKNLKKYELFFYFVCWQNEKKLLKKKFKKIYKPIKFIEIKDKSFSNLVKKIKIPDTAVNSENIFKMWYSFHRGCQFLKREKFKLPPKYILRYRSDLLPSRNQEIKLNSLKEDNIFIPDLNHWNGVNDQLFIFHFSKIDKILCMFKFLNEYINKNLLFSSELIFQRFLIKYKLNIKYIDYNYKIMKKKIKNNQKNILRNKKSFIPIKEKIFISINKLKFKLRNFKEFYVTKNKRNKYQDFIIE